ncbi:hypothetical protein H6P81_008532 [Aristolochia fimbriata]|uniref:Tropomyosin n=1 Tax=Aristolochia fimbriata TaxID=158543 RepID=A0AAV7EIA5_ARIFI|nr:hypothetical protein H6P81_008532 [Aristolochia fimbriata]
MEEYLRNMKALRSQMNDFEDQTASISAEEEKQKTAIQILEKDLDSVKVESTHFESEMNEMLNTKARVLSQVAEKKKRLLCLETESSTLSQTLELLEQEKATLSERLKDKRAYYAKETEKILCTLQEQQDWFNKYKLKDEVKGSPNGRSVKQGIETCSVTRMDEGVKSDGTYSDLLRELEDEKAKLDELTTKQLNLSLQKNKAKSAVDDLKCRLNDFPSKLNEMDAEVLEEEHKSLLSDKTGEEEYLRSLQVRIGEIKGISEVVNCTCGQEYTVQPHSFYTS